MTSTPPLPPPPAASSSPSPGVAPHLGRAFGGIWRLTFRRFLVPSQALVFAGMLVLLAVIAAATIRQGRAPVFFRWTTNIYLGLLVPVMAFLSGGGAMRDEMKPGAVDYVLTRPVWRPAFLWFKFLAHLACLQVVFLFPLGVMFAVGAYRNIPALAESLPWWLLGQAMTVTAFVALGFLCSAVTSRYVILGLVYAAIIEAAIGRIPTQLNRLAMTHHVNAMIATALQTKFLPANRLAEFVPESAGAAALNLLGFSVVALAIAAVVFSRRELAGARPSDT